MWGREGEHQFGVFPFGNLNWVLDMCRPTNVMDGLAASVICTLYNRIEFGLCLGSGRMLCHAYVRDLSQANGCGMLCSFQ